MIYKILDINNDKFILTNYIYISFCKQIDFIKN